MTAWSTPFLLNELSFSASSALSTASPSRSHALRNASTSARTGSASAPASKRSAPSAIAPNELRAWWRARRRKQERPLDPHPVDLDQEDAGESAGTGGNDLVGAIIEIGRDKGINLRRSLTSASVWAKCETCGHQAGMNVDVLAETLVVPIGGSRVALQSLRGQFNTRPAWHTSREAWGVGGRTRR